MSWRLDWNTGQLCFTCTLRSLHSWVCFSPTLFCGLYSYLGFHTINYLCIASSVHLAAFLTSPKFWGCGPEETAANLKYIINVIMFCSPWCGQSCRWADEPLVCAGIQFKNKLGFLFVLCMPRTGSWKFLSSWLLQLAFLKRSEFLCCRMLNFDHHRAPLQVFHI